LPWVRSIAKDEPILAPWHQGDWCVKQPMTDSRRTLISQNTTLQIGLTWSVTLKRTTRYDGVKYGFPAPRSCGNQLLGLQNDQQLQIVPSLSCIVLALAEK